MEKVVVKQLSLFTRIKNTVENMKKLGAANITKGVVTSRLELLEKNWNSFCGADDELTELYEESNHSYFKEDVRGLCEEAYLTQKAALLDLQDSWTDGKSQTSNKETSRKSLPKIELPIFSGNYKEWTHFKDLFQALVIQDTSLSDAERLQYLNTSLTGEPAARIQHIPVTNANFQRAWSTLNERYQNLRVLIHAELKTLMSLPTMKKEAARELLALYNGTMDAVEALEALERPVKHWDDWLVFVTSEKLDQRTKLAWETTIRSSRDPPTFEALATFLAEHARALEQVEGASGATALTATGTSSLKEERKTIINPSSRFKAHATSTREGGYSTKEGRKRACALCKQEHFVLFCPIYKKGSPQERKRLVTERNLCFNCLGEHAVRDCKSNKRCQSCLGKHHSSIHIATEQLALSNSFQQGSQPPCDTTNFASSSQTNETTGRTIHCSSTSTETSSLSIVLATAKLFVESERGERVVMRALIDPCSEISLIDESAVQLLNLKKKPASFPVIGVGKAQTQTRGMVSLKLFSRINTSASYSTSAYVLSRLSAYQSTRRSGFASLPHLEGLQLADPEYLSPGKISLILGADLYAQILRPGLKFGPPPAPIAQATSLGWIITGPLQQASDSSAKGNHAISLQCSPAETGLSEVMSRFWKLEEVSPPPHLLNTEEKLCEDHFAKTYARDSGGRYEVRLPFAKPPHLLGESRKAAVSQFLSLERRLARNSVHKKPYDEFLREYEQLGHMERVGTSYSSSKRTYFLPHHEVLRESSSTTRVRVVFNASRKTSTGVSLNDLLHKGPNLLPEIFPILLRWRLHAVVFSADVEKMYRQIRVAREDCDFQRILWRRNTEEPIEEFRLLTVTYGLACAPYLAIRVLRQLCLDEGDKYPLAAKCLNRDTYVDDVVSGAKTVSEAKHLRDELLALTKAGGFNLRKWTSNTSELLKDLPRELVANSLELSCNFDETSSLLGLKWHTGSDSFLFSIKLRADDVVTKRTVFREIASLFDPLGLISPVITTAKIFLQSLWLLKIDWDEPLPTLQAKNWLKFHAGLFALSSLRIPRWLSVSHNDELYELHGFADASERAYAAVIYLRILSNSNPKIILITSKTRVAPLRQVSLPRLELCAATLLARSIQSVTTNLDISPCSINLWSDSTIVLSWLQQHPGKWKTFVANRVAEIQDTLPNANWRHLKSAENPADAASRGLSGKEILTNNLWWKGPAFLSIRDYDFDQHSIANLRTESEIRTSKATCAMVVGSCFWEELITKFSAMNKLCSTLGWCLRFVTNARGSTKSRLKSQFLNAKELHIARLTVIRAFQRSSFPKECDSLLRAASVSCGSLAHLAPFLDDEGILRVGGRIKHSLLDYGEKHPIILPKQGHLITLLIREAHGKTLHGGTQLTLSTLRQNYWILCGRRAVRSCIASCTTCWRWRAKHAQQLMGTLPAPRVRPARPFVNSGVDYAGPYLTKIAPGRGYRSRKSYVAIFVCMATRAVHLELVSDYTTDAFLAAYRRFISRRGLCSALWSDQGTNFVGANRELGRLFAQARFDWDQAASLLAKDGTTWHFNPPAAPHFGGLWEAAVKSMKFHLRRVIGDHLLSFEEMSTVLAQIEACLNSRPLTPLNDDPDSLDILTPSHFLIGSPMNAVPEPSLADTSTSHLSRWQLLQRMRDHFWKRWAAEHLQHLQVRQKWLKEKPNVKTGELCLVTDELTPPTKWPLGRITETHAGKDGKVRVVTIRTPHSILRRPISKICVFPREQFNGAT